MKEHCYVCSEKLESDEENIFPLIEGKIGEESVARVVSVCVGCQRTFVVSGIMLLAQLGKGF